MATYTFTPKSFPFEFNWSDSTIWSGGVVPNAPDADVVMPIFMVNGFPTDRGLHIQPGQSFSARSLSITNHTLLLDGDGKLTVSGHVAVNTGGTVRMFSGQLSAGSLENNGSVGGAGQVFVAGLFSNKGTFSGGAPTVTAGSMINTGTLLAPGAGTLTVNTPSGGFTNLSGSTLTGGTYQTGGPFAGTYTGQINLNVGGSIATNAAKIEINGGDIATFDAASGAFIPIQSTMHSISSSGSLSLAVRTFNWTDLTVAGALILTARPGAANPVFNAPSLIVDATGQVAGSGTIHAPITNNGVILSTALMIDGAVAGSGRFDVAAGGTLELNGATSQAVKFLSGSGVLALDNPASFTGSIIPAGAGDQIKLAGVSLNSVTGYDYSDGGSGGVLTIHRLSGDIQLTFSGHFSTQSFTFSGGDQPFSPGLSITEIGFVTVPAYPTASGNIDEWILSNGRWELSAGPGSQLAGFRVAAVADFTGDHTSDVLWQNVSTGGVVLWKMSHGAWAGSVDFGAYPGAGFQVAGAGDFNGDGTSDVFFFNPSTGATDIWQLVNGNWAGSAFPGNHPLGYQAAGIGDFNHDGTSDVLWFNPSTGHVDEWNIVNGHWAGSNSIGTHPGAGWQVGGIGDFNKDGTSDVFWYNPGSGATDIWLLANGTWAASINPGNHPAGWNVAGVGDFNGDGHADVLFHDPSTGRVDEWVLVNGHWTASIALGAHPGSSWSVAGIGDFNGSGTSDVLWHQFV